MKTFAIIGSVYDYHSSCVDWALNECGIKSKIFDTYFGLNNELELDSSFNERDCVPSLIWTRRIFNPSFSDASEKDENFYFSQRERIYFRDNWISCMEKNENVDWINRPSTLGFAERKIIQLRCAKEANIRIPITYIGGDINSVERIFKDFDDIVVKPFAPYTWVYKNGDSTHAMARKIKKSSLLHYMKQNTSDTPSIFQECIKKVADLRIFSVGGELFTVRITCKNPDKYGIDVREYQSEANEVNFSKVDIKESDKSKIKKMMEALCVDVASMDFAEDKNGDLVFLDLNPGGAWLFLEESVPGLNLLQKTCSYISHRLGYDNILSNQFPNLSDFEKAKVFPNEKDVYNINGQKPSRKWFLNNRIYCD